jgi:2'-hydroxyisoflavone reductase
MRILVLGGTSFVGRAIVESALDKGHEVTVFHRGRTGADLFPGIDRRIGDRDTGDYSALLAGEWDAVADVSGYLPRHVGQAVAVLGDRVGRYLFVSSHAVYERTGVGPDSDEDTPRRPARRDVARTEDLDEETYGPSKVACEDDVLTAYGDRATIVRAGKVAGPHDPQDGLTYWVRRAARGGRVALPGSPAQPVQVVDVRDVSAFVVRLLADGRPGAYHAVGPAEPVTMSALVDLAARVAGSEVEIVPVPFDPRFPLVRPESLWHTQQRSAARARAAGLESTPLEVTMGDVLAWDRARGEPSLDRGLSPEEEAKLLAEATD